MCIQNTIHTCNSIQLYHMRMHVCVCVCTFTYYFTVIIYYALFLADDAIICTYYDGGEFSTEYCIDRDVSLFTNF